MALALYSAAFLIAALCAGLMGFAIQRGATCTVAAVEEVVSERRFRRLAAIVEAALWVAAGLIVANQLHALPSMPVGYAVSGWTLIGGLLLGLGAFVNGACVFGAIARLGSGEWVFIVTPIGFYLGCLSVAVVFGVHAPTPLQEGSPVLHASAWLVLPLPFYAAWRFSALWRGSRGAGISRVWHEALAAHAWSPHVATTIIGITFLLLLLLVGAWAYTDVLAELASGMAGNIVARTLLLGALLSGAVLAGVTARSFRSRRVSGAQLLRCAAGSMLMGWGSLLLPGGNDGLVLLAMPLAWPYAWLAFATMCATIAAAQLALQFAIRHGR
jgi:hypothetical protein